ncbi:hypothetical protein Hanom_Chr11g00996321 [Helianthus anomalus]
MKAVKMGNNKLLVNVARFAVENNNEPRPPVKANNNSHGFAGSSSGGRQYQPFSSFIPIPLGTSYKDTLVGNPKSEKLEEKVVDISIFVKPFEGWVNKSLFVRTTDLSTLVKLDKLLANSDGIKVEFKYVGGLYMLLTFTSTKEMIGQDLPFERIAWLKITRVPLHLLDNEVFDLVGRMFGKVVHASSLSKDSNNVTFDLVGVLRGDGERICKSVTLNWKDRKYKVWVSEELGDWVPNCLSNVDVWEETSVSVEDCGDDGSSPLPASWVFSSVTLTGSKSDGMGVVRQLVR